MQTLAGEIERDGAPSTVHPGRYAQIWVRSLNIGTRAKAFTTRINQPIFYPLRPKLGIAHAIKIPRIRYRESGLYAKMIPPSEPPRTCKEGVDAVAPKPCNLQQHLRRKTGPHTHAVPILERPSEAASRDRLADLTNLKGFEFALE
jgi:hypothetical protein